MIQVEIVKSTELDDYEKGCLPETYQDFGVIETFKAPNMEAAMELIIKFHGKPYLFDDRLELQVTENGDGQEPMEYQSEEWKKGNRKLYASTYSFYFTEIFTRKIENAEFKRTFPNIEED